MKSNYFQNDQKDECFLFFFFEALVYKIARIVVREHRFQKINLIDWRKIILISEDESLFITITNQIKNAVITLKNKLVLCI
jgi:hypothetical protein